MVAIFLLEILYSKAWLTGSHAVPLKHTCITDTGSYFPIYTQNIFVSTCTCGIELSVCCGLLLLISETKCHRLANISIRDKNVYLPPRLK